MIFPFTEKTKTLFKYFKQGFRKRVFNLFLTYHKTNR